MRHASFVAVLLALTLGACETTPTASRGLRRDIITGGPPSVTVDHDICAGPEVDVWAKASGGSGHYTYLWSGPTWTGDPRFFYSGSRTGDTVHVVWTAGNNPGAKARLTVTLFVRDSVTGDSVQGPFTIPCSV